VEVLAGFGLGHSFLHENNLFPVNYSGAYWPATTEIEARYGHVLAQVDYIYCPAPSIDIGISLRLSAIHVFDWQDASIAHDSSQSQYNYSTMLNNHNVLGIEPAITARTPLGRSEDYYLVGQIAVMRFIANSSYDFYPSPSIYLGAEYRF
jgi:hypothetical protein